MKVSKINQSNFSKNLKTLGLIRLLCYVDLTPC